MSLWTDSEFGKVAASTRITSRTLAACRDVLVDGSSGQDASTRHQMFHAQISRALGVLRQKHAEMLQDAKPAHSNVMSAKVAAQDLAKAMVGQGFSISDPLPGNSYEGPVVVCSYGFLIQKVGRAGVIHDVEKLDRETATAAPLSISYPKTGGKAIVTEITAEFVRSRAQARRWNDQER